MAQLLLVRHGQASWGSDDYDVLSPTGEEQSRILGATLAARGVVPDVLVRGAMRRHRQTTDEALAAAGWSADVVEDSGWDEFDHLGMLAVHPAPFGDREPSKEEFQSWFEGATARWTAGENDADYAESFPAFGVRVEDALRRTTAALGPAGTAVVFTSGGPVSWATASLIGGQAASWAQLNRVVVNSSVTKVVVGGRGATLVSFNEHTHLEGEGAALLTYR